MLLCSLALLPNAADLLLPGLLLVVIGTWLVVPELPRWLPAAVVILSTTVIVLAREPNHTGVIRASAFALVSMLVCVLWVQIDIVTRRAESLTSSLRTRAETVLARVPHPLVVTDVSGNLVSHNQATTDAFGVDPDPGTPCAESLGLHHGERALDCAAGCALLSLCSPDTDDVEVWRSGSAGVRQPLLASVAEIHDTAGRVIEVVHSLRDITRLKEADEAKTIFLATASHELKTPLTVINGYAQLLLRDDMNPVLRQQGLEAIAGRAKELAGIVERLLLSSRIESGSAVDVLAPVDLGGCRPRTSRGTCDRERTPGDARHRATTCPPVAADACGCRDLGRPPRRQRHQVQPWRIRLSRSLVTPAEVPPVEITVSDHGDGHER